MPILLSVLCLTLIGGGVLLFLQNDGAETALIGGLFQVEGLDPAAKTGAPHGVPKDERAPVGEDLFSYRINDAPKFNSEGKGGNIMVQNPSFNQYLMVLEIALDGKLLYQSQYIAPNQYISEIDLEHVPAAGEHLATAYFNAIDPKTFEFVDVLEAPVTIVIK